MRRIPFFPRLRDASPRMVRDTLVRVLKKRTGGQPVWSDAGRRWVAEQLAEDTRAFLTRYGKPVDFWGDLLAEAG